MNLSNFTSIINGRTSLLGVFGDPISHSLSPAMHNAAYQFLGWNCVYIPCQVRSLDLTAALDGVRALNFKGVNLTIPHKQSAGTRVDDIFGDARRSGSINTIINRGGKLYGTSTDGIGLIHSLQIDGNFDLTSKRVLILGAGGTAAAVIYNLIDAGIHSLILTNRSIDKAFALQQRVRSFTGFETSVIPLTNLKELDWAAIDLIINTTAVGLHDDESLIAKELLRPHHFIYDVNYKRAGTRLITEATIMGCQVLTGLSLLIFQGAESFKLWFDIEPPLDIMREAVLTSIEI